MNQWPAISDIAQKIQAGELNAKKLVSQSLKSIEESSSNQAIISAVDDRAKKRAEEVDKLVSLGKKAGRLAGVPFIAKDNFMTFGGKTTAASNILKPFEAPYQATAIEKLETKGAKYVSKTTI